MSKLVQYIEWNLPGVMSNKMYCYGEANFEVNQAMQEPLERLYKYENQPDMREKIREYISELDVEIDRYIKENEKILESISIGHDAMPISQFQLAEKIEILTKVKNDLQSRLDELI